MRLAVALLLLALSGCASMQDEMQPWMGRNKTALIETWGPPMSVSSDGQGGTILYYFRAHGYSSAKIWVYAHANGTLYYWRAYER